MKDRDTTPSTQRLPVQHMTWIDVDLGEPIAVAGFLEELGRLLRLGRGGRLRVSVRLEEPTEKRR